MFEMLTVSFFFDSLQLIPKIFILLGIATAGFVGWIPFFGQIAGVAALGAGMGINFVLTLLLTVAGYSWMWGWLQTRGVQVVGGTYLAKKTLFFPLSILLEVFVSILPGITLWTFTMIYFARKEDKEAHVKILQRAEQALHAHERQLEQQQAYLAMLKTQRLAYAQAEREMRTRAENDNERRFVGIAANDNVSEPQRAQIGRYAA